DETIVVLPKLIEQLDFVLRHELQPIHVVAELVELAKRARQRRVVGRDERGNDAVELARHVMLHLTIGLDLALQLDQLLGAFIDPAQNVETCRPHDDQEHRNREKRGQQLGLNAGRHARHQADERVQDSHYRSATRLNKSRRNSSGSKRTPRYCTRRKPRGSIIEVRNVWSTSPLAFFDAKTPYRRVTSRIAAGAPVRNAQPARLAPKASAYSFSTSGVSRSGSTVIETKTIFSPKSWPSRS